MNRCRFSVLVQQPASAFAGFRFPPEVILLAAPWCQQYGLSYRDLEELLAERDLRCSTTRVAADRPILPLAS